jgi:hypothetical protein
MVFAEPGPGGDEDQDIQQIEGADRLARDEDRKADGDDVQQMPR